MSNNKMPDHEMIVIAFDNEYEADKVLDTLKARESMDVVDLKNGAVIVRSESGDVKINETSDFDTKQGAIGGLQLAQCWVCWVEALSEALFWARRVARRPVNSSTWASKTIS